MPARPPPLLLALCLLAAWLPGARAARAESELRLAYPEAFGAVPASTYDTNRHRVGAAHLVIEKLDNRDVRIFAESGFDGGARQVSTALFEPSRDGRTLQPVLQESRSFYPNGSLRSTMSVDHRARTGTCGRSTPEGMKLERIDLPASDRVANVVLTLLFEPLVKGDEPARELPALPVRGRRAADRFRGLRRAARHRRARAGQPGRGPLPAGPGSDRLDRGGPAGPAALVLVRSDRPHPVARAPAPALLEGTRGDRGARRGADPLAHRRELKRAARASARAQAKRAASRRRAEFIQRPKASEGGPPRVREPAPPGPSGPRRAWRRPPAATSLRS